MNNRTNIQKLLVDAYTSKLCKKHNINPNQIYAQVCAPTEVTCESEFDLIDKQNTMIVKVNKGNVTYINQLKNEVAVTNYESYVLSLPESIQKGMKRSDFIVYDNKSYKFIILNEIARRKNEFDKESDAIRQLSETLDSLLTCPEVAAEVKKYAVRACVFSNRCIKIKSPMGMADPFNYGLEINDRISVTVKEDIPAISSLGFDYFKSSKIDISTDVKFFVG